MKNIKILKNCEVCGSRRLASALNLGNHPLCDDLIKIDSKKKGNKYPIKILFCKKCFTAHQKFQVSKKKLFPKTYHYRARFTADVLSGMDDLVKSVEKKFNSLKNLTVLDIGCNDGSLLDRFKSKGAKTIGIEPTGASKDAKSRGHIIINDFFSKKTSKNIKKKYPKINIITFTNVFAHIENLPKLLTSLSSLISEDTLLVIENHYLGSILSKNQFDTFYHEHPRTYSLTSFSYIARSLNCEILSVEFPKRYGGNIRVMLGKKKIAKLTTSSLITVIKKKELKFFDKFRDVEAFLKSWKSKKREEIVKLARFHGKIHAKAFPGRAAILIKLLKITDKEIDCVYEKPGSEKIGYYVPGTQIPIKSDLELIKNISNIKFVLNLAWHIPKEIKKYLKSSGFKGKIINII